MKAKTHKRRNNNVTFAVTTMRKTMSHIICVCMVLTLIPVMTDNVEAISSPAISTVYQSSLENQAVTVEWSSGNTGSDYSFELQDMNSGVTKNLAGSVRKYTFQNLSQGQVMRLRIRAYRTSEGYSKWSSIWNITVQRGTGNSNYGYKESGGDQIYWNSLGRDVWKYGTSVDYDAVYYEFKTSERSDSTYRFECRGINDDSVNMELLNYGAPPRDEDAWKIVAYGTKNSSECTSYTKELQPNRTYRLRVYFTYGHSVNTAFGGIPYRIKVTEIIKKPAKGKVTSWKAGKKKATVKYSKIAKATRYQIAYKIKGGSYKYINTKYRSRTIKGLKSKKYYYVKVRGQRYANGKYYSGPWSAVKRVKIK